jgi:hypothetical protein
MRHHNPCCAISTILFIVLAFFTSLSRASDWKEITLEGSFTGFSGAKGVGQVSYSFALNRTVSQGGDLHMMVNLRDVDEVGFFFEGPTAVVDLGALKTPPRSVKKPSAYEVVTPLVVGHYYYITVAGGGAVLQPLNFSVLSRKDTGKTSFWYGTEEIAQCRLRFRYVYSEGGRDNMKSVLAGTSKNNGNQSRILKDNKPLQTPSITTGRVSHSPSKSFQSGSPKIEIIKDRNKLLSDFLALQKDSRAFLDRETELASVQECTELFEKAQVIDSSIGALLETETNKYQMINARIESTRGQLQSTKNLQIADRMRTEIESWTSEIASRERSKQEWNGRRSELLTTMSTLREFQAFLEILER